MTPGEVPGEVPGEALGRYLGGFVAELSAAGVRHVCLCPGSRSTPLALTLARHPGIRVWTHLDERSCAYFALGMAKASREPVAILCSSGTATLNFAPAVVEAFHAGVPLIVLTADRPPELREIGANQTIDQSRVYGSAAKWAVEMLLPDASDEALRYARMAARRAVATALDGTPGPVHLNFPFREPLMPDRDAQVAAAVGVDSAPAVSPARQQPADREIDAALDDVSLAKRGLIVCGPQDDAAFPAAVTRLGQRLGYPVLADPLSNVRCGPHHAESIVGAYDAFLRDPALASRLAPDFVLRFGAAPVSKPLATFLQAHRDARQLLISPGLAWRDPELTASAVVQSDATAFCETLLAALPESTPPADGWVASWRNAERATVKALDACLRGEDRLSEPGVVHALAGLLPDGATVFAGNSMPVRDIDACFPAEPRGLRFLGNRGASGIDGVVSSALGAAAVSAGRVALVIGDLSFYHDMNGLLAARRHGLDATIVLINNDGGGIFSFLEQTSDPEHFEALFGTPHGLDFAPVAALYGLDFSTVETPDAYREALAASFARPGVSVIEVRTNRAANVETHRALWQAVSTAVNGAPSAHPSSLEGTEPAKGQTAPSSAHPEPVEGRAST